MPVTLQAIIEDACAKAVKRARGNKSLAADRLQINRVTLRKYLLGFEKRLKSNQQTHARSPAGGYLKRDS